eukprot:TRINITY_DN10511_c0_g1_i1.p1 TRINITY_DN10511_c0_g1~~TRINITY_DN10511_c0_g1_i1.p1  ORF type:complete len:277 (-),score=48.15 TRINITY_DN10511_c0_g1_i1:189-1019(-)
MPSEPSTKSARVNLPDTPPQSWIDAFTTAVDKSLDAKLAPINNRISDVEKHQTDMQTQMSDMNGRLKSLESRSNQDTISTADTEWRPERIEVKGWCPWSSRSTSGKTRAEILILHAELVECLSEDLQSQVGKPMVYNKMNTSYHVKISGDGLYEVVGAWRDKIASGVTCDAFNLCDFFVRPELSPTRKKCNQAMARVISFLEHHGGSKWKFSNKWHPEFIVVGKLTDGSMEQEVLCAEINVANGGQVVFHEHTKKVCGINSIENITMAFRLFKVQR